MKEKIKLRRWLNTPNHYIEIEDEHENSISSIKVIDQNGICNQLFIDRMMNAIDAVYTSLKIESPYARELRMIDEARQEAVADIVGLLLIITNSCTGGGSIVNDDANRLLEIAKKYTKK